MQRHRSGGFLTLMPLSWKNFFSSACGRVGSVCVRSYCNNHLISQLKDRIRKLLEGWVIWVTVSRHFLLVCSSSVRKLSQFLFCLIRFTSKIFSLLFRRSNFQGRNDSVLSFPLLISEDADLLTIQDDGRCL